MSMQNPALKVRLRKGLAERNRLPLTTMLKILEECRLLVNEFARRHSAGKDIDLQLEIVGSPNGDAFQAGSLQACISAGAHPEIAALAMNEVIGQLMRIERNDISFVHGDAGAAEIVRRFYRIGLQQEKVSSELELSMSGSGEAGYSCGNLTAEGMKSVRSLQTPNAEVRGIQIYGKLMELRDIMESDDHGRGFVGELLRDGGEQWRVRFREDRQAIAGQLFRKRVLVFGDVKYFRTRTPLITAQRIEVDEPKDYLAAFDKFVGSIPELKEIGLNELIQAVREED